MQSAYAAALEFLEQAGSATQLSELEAQFQHAIGGFGFSRFNCVQVRGPGEPLAPRLLFGCSREPWDLHYWAEGYLAEDPCVGVLLGASFAFSWDEVRRTAVGRGRLMFDEACEFGLRNGVVVPVHGPGGALKAVRLLSECEDIDPAARATLHALGVVLAERGASFAPGAASDRREASPLTAREREVLLWVGEGKSDWDMGMILGISAGTAHFHVTNAMKKLDARTRLQAWSRAQARGWLVNLPDQ